MDQLWHLHRRCRSGSTRSLKVSSLKSLLLPLPEIILLVAHGLEMGSPPGRHGLPELCDLRGVPEQRLRVGPGLPRHCFCCLQFVCLTLCSLRNCCLRLFIFGLYLDVLCLRNFCLRLFMNSLFILSLFCLFEGQLRVPS